MKAQKLFSVNPFTKKTGTRLFCKRGVFLFFIIPFMLSFRCNHQNKELALPTIEMLNSYKKGDWFSLNTTSSIKRNDLVAFKRKGMLYNLAVDDTDYLRVVGVPGDSIKICKGIIWVNNKPLKTVLR